MVKKRDIILAGCLILIGLMLTVGLKIFMKSGNQVVVYVDGEKIGTYNLAQDGTYEIQTEKGYNQIKIEEGTVWMVSADCPDALCVHMGKISKAGETIVCLPHRLVLQVEGEDAVEYDIK